MAPQFIRLKLLEKARSFSFARNVTTALLSFVLIFAMLFYLMGIAVFLGLILRNVFEIQDIPSFLNRSIIFYLAAEFISRLFLQKKPIFDLSRYLHLPIRRTGVVHFLLLQSLISPFSLIVIILFLPVTISEIAPVFGSFSAFRWLATLFLFSISMHWFTFWIRDILSDSPSGFFALFACCLAPFLLFYLNIFDPGTASAPFFSAALNGPFPLILMMLICVLAYWGTFSRYLSGISLDRISQGRKTQLLTGSVNFFTYFGLPGKLADIELKLILRHKKSRGYLWLSAIMLLYGLLFYQSPDSGEPAFSSSIYLFAGIFITGIFVIQYAQFFLSWNSSFFDFFMTKEKGLESLIRGKFLLLSTTVLAAYILTLPYVYFGWHIVAINTAASLFNAGIGIHVIMRLSLWEPKPMNINKGALFNYDGIGFAQFVMGIPFFLAPYLIYLPVMLIFSDTAAILSVGTAGALGILFHNKLIDSTVRRVRGNRYKISSTFRRGT